MGYSTPINIKTGRVKCVWQENRALKGKLLFIFHVFVHIRRNERYGYTHAHDSLSKQTRRRRGAGGGKRGGQQKAAAAPFELEQKTRTQRRSLLIRSETKPSYSDRTIQIPNRPTLLCSLIAPFCAFRSESAQSDSCCLGATSQTRWRTRPCHSVARPAQ